MERKECQAKLEKIYFTYTVWQSKIQKIRGEMKYEKVSQFLDGHKREDIKNLTAFPIFRR